MSNALDLNTRTIMQGTYGNVAHEEVTIGLVNGDLIASLNNFAKLPAGLRILDWHLQITTASNATVTANIGLKSTSGVNQDAPTYFFAAQALSATGMFRKNNILLPFTLQQDMFVQLVPAVANITQVTAMTLHLFYKNVGTP